jgi:alpha-glucosidase
MGQKKVTLYSPNGKLLFSFMLSHKAMSYQVVYKGATIINPSPLGLEFENDQFTGNLAMNRPVFRDTTEDYDLVVGKTKKVHTHYKEVTIPLEEKESPFRKVNVIVRIFNEGIAFRYQFVAQHSTDSITILDENTTFNLAGNPMVHALLLPNYTTSHEGEYTHTLWNDLKPDTLMDMPALFQFPGNIYMAITEAELLDYAGMYLSKHGNLLVSKLSPLPHQSSIKVKALLPHFSPWRVMLISDRIGDLVESNIITTLNEPCKIKDVSWIKPGKTTFPWWNGNVVSDTINAPGNNFVTNQYYIDFCARNHIEYHTVVEYGLHQWYVDDGVDFQPGPHSDVTTPVPGLDMQAICDYAKKEGVGIRVWVHFYALYPALSHAFALFEQWGIKGMMVDFMDRDDQEMVNMQTEILQKAAAHHLHIQFHGAYKPTGLSRTYPNEFTREGTRNYEVDKWDDHGLSPDHDIIMPFTRVLAGSTDYHLGGFRAVPQNKYRAQYTRPLVLGTRCHMLAMYVVLENYLQMVCDYPEAYEGQPGFEFIQEVSTTWDETKVLDAAVNEFIIIARRKNNDWYVGSITNHEGREVKVPLNFLSEGKYVAEIYSDADDTNVNPNHLNIQKKEVTNKDTLSIKIAGGGGFTIQLIKE